MDLGELRCCECGHRLSESDFSKAAAYWLGEKPACAPCTRILIPSMSPDEQRILQLKASLRREEW